MKRPPFMTIFFARELLLSLSNYFCFSRNISFAISFAVPLHNSKTPIIDAIQGFYRHLDICMHFNLLLDDEEVARSYTSLQLCIALIIRSPVHLCYGKKAHRVLNKTLLSSLRSCGMMIFCRKGRSLLNGETR